MGGHAAAHRRISVGPAIFTGLGILVILLLSVLFFPRTRHRSAVNQMT
jgi:multidrug transporter EmrE-like cation transporter